MLQGFLKVELRDGQNSNNQIQGSYSHEKPRERGLGITGNLAEKLSRLWRTASILVLEKNVFPLSRALSSPFMAVKAILIHHIVPF